MKKTIKRTIGVLMLIITCGLIARMMFPKVAIPIGVVMAAMFFVCLQGVMSVAFIRGITKKANKKDIIFSVTAFLCAFIIGIIFLVRGVHGTLDIITGPQEIIVSNAKIERVRGGSRTPDKWYFICVSQDGEEKEIKIHSKKDSDAFSQLIEECEEEYGLSAEYRLYHFKNINVVYDIKINE